MLLSFPGRWVWATATKIIRPRSRLKPVVNSPGSIEPILLKEWIASSAATRSSYFLEELAKLLRESRTSPPQKQHAQSPLDAHCLESGIPKSTALGNAPFAWRLVLDNAFRFPDGIHIFPIVPRTEVQFPRQLSAVRVFDDEALVKFVRDTLELRLKRSGVRVSSIDAPRAANLEVKLEEYEDSYELAYSIQHQAILRDLPDKVYKTLSYWHLGIEKGRDDDATLHRILSALEIMATNIENNVVSAKD